MSNSTSVRTRITRKHYVDFWMCKSITVWDTGNGRADKVASNKVQKYCRCTKIMMTHKCKNTKHKVQLTGRQKQPLIFCDVLEYGKKEMRRYQKLDHYSGRVLFFLGLNVQLCYFFSLHIWVLHVPETR